MVLMNLFAGSNGDADTENRLVDQGLGKERMGKVSMYEILVKGKYMQSSTYFSRRFLLVSGSFC